MVSAPDRSATDQGNAGRWSPHCQCLPGNGNLDAHLSALDTIKLPGVSQSVAQSDCAAPGTCYWYEYNSVGTVVNAAELSLGGLFQDTISSCGRCGCGTANHLSFGPIKPVGCFVNGFSGIDWFVLHVQGISIR